MTVAPERARAAIPALLLLVLVLLLDVVAPQAASAVNSLLRSVVNSGVRKACFWTELHDKAFEPADGASHPPFDQSFPTVEAAKATCLGEPMCRAVSLRLGENGEAAGDGSFIISDQRAATPVHGAMSWVRECELQQPIAVADDTGLAASGRLGSAAASTTEFLTIKVLTMDRLQSLKRLIDSLKDAYYDGDRVHIQFFVDFPKTDDSGVLAQKLNARRLIIDHLEAWEWPCVCRVQPKWTQKLTRCSSGAGVGMGQLRLHLAAVRAPHVCTRRVSRVAIGLSTRRFFSLPRRHGTKTIHVRIRNGGLIGQWLEAWWPNSDSEAAIVLEDDLSVSKYYYRWCKKAIAKYLWDPANFDPHTYGISLQRQ
jgi:hypothetical protein